MGVDQRAIVDPEIEPDFDAMPEGRLLRARDLHGNVTKPADYLYQQHAAIHAKLQTFPNLRWKLPWVSKKTVPVVVSDSQWQLKCPCGNYPLYDPEWALACCFTCGAIYRQAPPEDWKEIERVLLNRPKPTTRHMLPGQTLDELRAENREHGDPD